jgi:hypothetical protein
MNHIPFSVYDFFGYLAAGAVVIAGVIGAFLGSDLLQQSPSLPIGLLLLITAYTTGHIVANLAGDLVERRVVRKRLGQPTDILLGTTTLGAVGRRLLPGYASALPPGVQDRIKTLANQRGLSEDRGDALFFHCHAVMKSASAVQGRLETFITMYGFCRNMAVALLLADALLGIGILAHTADTGAQIAPGWWLAILFVGAIGMFYRYLKFYRQYAVELLTSYAESGT